MTVGDGNYEIDDALRRAAWSWRMSFCDDIERRTLPLMQGILSHPFVVGIGDGTLEVARFKHYISQDYAYLIDYARVLALCSARGGQPGNDDLVRPSAGPNPERGNGLAPELLRRVRHYRRGVGRNRRRPHYRGLYQLSAQNGLPGQFRRVGGGFAALPVGLLELGKHLAERGLPGNAPLYARWIDMYSNPEFGQLAGKTRDLANRLGEGAGPAGRAAMEDAYITCLRLERKFWDMGYNLEGWEE